jgi:hypothetical protein
MEMPVKPVGGVFLRMLAQSINQAKYSHRDL